MAKKQKKEDISTVTASAPRRSVVIAGAGDDVPYAWRNPLVDLENYKMTKALKNIKKSEAERASMLPARAEE